MTPKFTTACFVRVEDAQKRKELIEWLEKIGYILFEEPDEMIGNIVCCKAGVNDTPFYGLCPDYDMRKKFAKTAIDCGSHIDLFKALAAMNDENNREQWFISQGFKMFDKLKGNVETSTGRRSIMAGEWFKPLINNIKFKWLGDFSFRKASAQEIIEHFKNKEK